MGVFSAKTAPQRQQIKKKNVEGFWAAVKLNIYGVGLMALWTVVNTVLLPDRVDATAPASVRGTALGLISLIGVGAAAFFQPWAGQLSDRAPLSDRRRPFIAAGTVGICGFVLLLGWAPGFWLLLTAYVFLQLSSNLAQTAFQAFIPDLVNERGRGLASGVKNALSVVGAAVIGLLGFAVLTNLFLVGVAGVLLAVAVGSFLATNWALLTDHLPQGQGARSLGVANIATAGAGALAGLFGPLVDLARGVPYVDAYAIAFGLCVLIAASAFWPLHAIAQQLHDDGKK